MPDSSTYPFMQFSLFLLFSTLLAFSLFFLCVEQVSVLTKARTTQRALYSKRAMQNSHLAFTLSILSSAFVAYYYREFSLSLAFSIGCTLFTLLWLIAIKVKSSFLSVISGTFSLLFSLSLSTFFFGSCYVQFYTNYPMTFLFELVPADVGVIQFTQELYKAFLPYITITNERMYRMLSLFLCLALSGNSISSALQLQNTLFSRKKDDFGRDYYSATISALGKNAFRSTLSLTILILIYIILSYTQYDYMPFDMSELSLILLLLPIATANFAILGLSYNPLRHKIAIIMSPFIVFVGSAYFLFQSIIPLSHRVIEKL